MQGTLLQQGMDITLFGMGIVFSFLMVLVIATGIMSRIILRNLPDAATPSSGSQTPDDARLRAIIKAAIQQHRNRKKK